jgi:hypothetical protein
MRVGIVGHEGAKFTHAAEAKARALIRELLAPPDAVLVSGHCHLGGIDIWAEEEAQALGRKMIIFPPKKLVWQGGFKDRNLQIAAESDIVHSIVVEKLPPTYRGMRFTTCYHCKDKAPPHAKSGGCWTAWRCRAQRIHIIGG